MDNQNPIPQIVEPQKLNSEPKSINLLPIILFIFLVISTFVAGFFAVQTQKLANELSVLKSESNNKKSATPLPVLNNDVTMSTASPSATTQSLLVPAVNLPEAGKPVIYFYPEKPLDILVKLDFNGQITDSYPLYDNKIKGWDIKALPNGKIINNQDGKGYSYIFWEGLFNNQIFTTKEGFVVSGEDTLSFLQKKLKEIGLKESEYNEFIVYWLPRMQHNKYNLISFVQDEYTNNAKLTIIPKPDSLLRVFMTYKPLDNKIEIKPQTFKTFERNGFTIVEWGGTKI